MNPLIDTLTAGGSVAMVDRVDLLIAVIGIVVSVLGSSTALWVALAKKPDKEDLARLEMRFGADLNRVETKLDAFILRLVPEPPPTSGLGGGRG